MNDLDIEMLLSLHSEKNITKTSDKLFLTQPGLTKRIKKLEEEFNVPIIVRYTKGVIFTPQGEKLISHLKKLKVVLENIKDDVSSTLSEVQGSLRLGISPIFAHHQLPNIIQGYLKKYPKVELLITSEHSRNIYKLLQSDELSLGIVGGDFNWDEKKILLYSQPICIAYKEKISFDDLFNLPYIHYRADPSLQYQLNMWWSERDLNLPKAGVTTNRMDTCLDLVKSGVGWSMLPYETVKDYVDYAQKLFLKDGTPFNRRTWLYYKEDYLQLSTVSTFIDYVQSYNFYE